MNTYSKYVIFSRLLKPVSIFSTAALLIAGGVLAGSVTNNIVPGQVLQEVEDELGEPVGKMQSGGRTIWLYPRGTVEFDKGKVVRSSFISDADYTKEQAKRAQIAEGRRLAVESARTNRQMVVTMPVGQGSGNRLAAMTQRFVRPFVRPVFDNVLYYNNIPIVFEISKWPPAMRQAYDVSVEIPVETGQRTTTFQTLPYELKKYPDEMLENTLRCIYMIRDIRGDDKTMNPAGLAFYTEGIVLEHTYVLHHELAHELQFLFHDVFPEKELAAVSGGYLGFEERKHLYYKDLWKLGFTSNYAMCSVAEDFAEFCDRLYLQPVVLFQAMKEYPKLKEKFDVIRPFLEMVKRRTTGDNAPMDEAYFSRFDRSVWRP